MKKNLGSLGILTIALTSFSQDTLKSFYPNGQLEYISVNGTGKGIHRQWYANGQIKLDYPQLKNESHGLCRQWYENGELHLKGHCDHDKNVGKWKFWDQQGRKKMVIYDGKKYSYTKQWDSCGHLSSYGYCKKLGYGATLYQNGKKLSMIKFKKGSPMSCSGFQSELEESPVLIICSIGCMTVTEKNGLIADEKGHTIKNHFRGKTKEWYTNGQLFGVCHYKKGKINGWLREWDQDGTLIRKKRFKVGKCVKTVKDHEGPYFLENSELPVLIDN